MNLDPLLLPEILSQVLEYADINTLKSSRLVSSFWNDEAGRIVSSSSWINPFKDLCKVIPEPDEPSSKLRELNETLETSADPSKFFGKLVIKQNSAWKFEIWKDVDEDTVGWTEILEKCGKYLNILDCQYWNCSRSSLNGPAAHLLLFRGLSEFCPLLQELLLTVQFEWSTLAVPSLEFKAPLNLRRMKLQINCDIKEGIEDYLVKILAASTKLKVLRISVGGVGTNDRLYQKLFALQEMTLNLREFEWIGRLGGEERQVQKILSTIHFSSNQLKILRLIH